MHPKPRSKRENNDRSGESQSQNVEWQLTTTKYLVRRKSWNRKKPLGGTARTTTQNVQEKLE
jgi:hypothetical protein